MNPQEFSDLLTELIIQNERSIRRSVRSYQRRLSEYLASLINSTSGEFALDIRKDGSIKPTTKNVQTLARIKRAVDRWLVENQLPGLAKLTSSYDEIADLNDEYIKAEFNNPPISAETRKRTIEAAKQQAVDTIVASTQNQSLADPIKKILDTATAAGGASRAQLISDLTQYIRGGDGKLGGLESFVSRYVRDSLNQTARSYQEIITGTIDRGDRWYFFTSGTVADSREFCISRNGQYWHESEVKAWAALVWQGKATGTNERTIFILVGGYNCMHQLILVSRSRVPQFALDRILSRTS